MESIHNFVISRAKISRSSVKVNDLFFTYNGENLQEDLTDIVEVANEKFPDLSDLNGATMTSLIHLFNEDEIKTCYFMCAISLLGRIEDKEFKLEFSSKRGNFLTVKSVTVEPKTEEEDDEKTSGGINENSNEEVGEGNNVSEEPKENESPNEVNEEPNGEETENNVSEEPKTEEVNEKETSEEPKEEDKKKLKEDKKKKAVKEASDKL